MQYYKEMVIKVAPWAFPFISSQQYKQTHINYSEDRQTQTTYLEWFNKKKTDLLIRNTVNKKYSTPLWIIMG